MIAFEWEARRAIPRLSARCRGVLAHLCGMAHFAYKCRPGGFLGRCNAKSLMQRLHPPLHTIFITAAVPVKAARLRPRVLILWCTVLQILALSMSSGARARAPVAKLNANAESGRRDGTGPPRRGRR